MRQMRRTLLVLALVATAGGLGVLAISAYSADRQYQRLIAAGDVALLSDQSFEALEAYSGAVALRPNAMLAHLKRGIAYESRGELLSAVRDLRRAVDLDPAAPRPLERLGDVNAALGRYDRAAESYERCLRLDDRSPAVLYKLGLARYRAGSAETAIEPLERAVALDTRLAEAHHLLGLALRDTQRPAEARAALEAASQLAPGLTAIREALADVYFELGERNAGLDQLGALVTLEPTRAERVVALGLAQAESGRRDAAVLTLARGIERFPDAGAIHAALGRVWLASAEDRSDEVALAKAIGALTTAAGRADASSATLTDYGRALMLAGETAAAERLFRQAVARLPVPPAAYLHLAELQRRDGRTQESRDSLIRYAILVGDDAPLTTVATRIATLSLRLGDARQAERWFERAIDESGSTPALLAGLADAVAQSGDLARAKALVDEGLAIEPTNEQLQRVKGRLPSRPPS